MGVTSVLNFWRRSDNRCAIQFLIEISDMYVPVNSLNQIWILEVYIHTYRSIYTHIHSYKARYSNHEAYLARFSFCKRNISMSLIFLSSSNFELNSAISASNCLLCSSSSSLSSATSTGSKTKQIWNTKMTRFDWFIYWLIDWLLD